MKEKEHCCLCGEELEPLEGAIISDDKGMTGFICDACASINPFMVT